MSSVAIRYSRYFVVLVLTTSITTDWSACGQTLPEKTAIDEYVNRPDDSYRWKIVSTQENGDVRTVVIDMVSQRWLSDAEVNRPQWQHWVTLAIPKKLKSDIGFLMIGGGKNGGDPPGNASNDIVQIAKATGTVVAELKMVPNQPLVFHGDGVPRTEDDLIGYTWDQYIKTGNAEWLARNAMVKSAVRAMDTMTAATAELSDGHRVDKFVVAGGSKRGWTTWLTGAIDDRVVGIAPIVIDVLNTDISMRHHFAAYGYWAPAVGNYVQHHIMERMDDPRLADAYRLVDPYYYRHRLTMPKLILNAAGDQFFLPDSSQFYWNDLQGEKLLRYVPNTDHSMDDSDALASLIAFYGMIVNGTPRPKVDWSVSDAGELTVTSSQKPTETRLWSATNADTRDFRLETFGRHYESEFVEANDNGEYVVQLHTPKQGWTAQFVELTFDVGMAVPLKVTTNVFVLPDLLPYKGKSPTATPSVTLKCEFPDTDTAHKVIQVAGELFAAKLSIDDLQTAQSGTTCYLNWQPNSFEPEAGAVMQWLQTQNCSQVNIQLEAGRGITTSPKQPDQEE